MSEKYHWLSPYAYCAADPINLIDPTGKNIWKIDTEGYVFNYEETMDYDKIIIVDYYCPLNFRGQLKN